MKDSQKKIYLLIAGMCNAVYFYVLDFWKYTLEGKLLDNSGSMVSIIFGIILGLFAILSLAFSETSILVQLYYRKKYSEFERKCFDNNMLVQILLLLLYYITSLIFSKVISDEAFMIYLMLLPILMAISLAKMSRIVWEKDDAIIFMDVDGQLVDIDEICVGKDTIELIYKSGNKKTIKKTKKITRLFNK